LILIIKIALTSRIQYSVSRHRWWPEKYLERVARLSGNDSFIARFPEQEVNWLWNIVHLAVAGPLGGGNAAEP